MRGKKKIPEFSSRRKILPEEFLAAQKILLEGFSRLCCAHG